MSDKILSWIKPYPELILDGHKVFCRACCKIVSTEKKTRFYLATVKKN